MRGDETAEQLDLIGRSRVRRERLKGTGIVCVGHGRSENGLWTTGSSM